MKFKSFLTAMLTWVALSLSAQQVTITGTVTDAKDGSSMPGVNVILKGTSKGTITSIDGNYSISNYDYRDIYLWAELYDLTDSNDLFFTSQSIGNTAGNINLK